MANFRVGQKVVCIKERQNTYQILPTTQPIVGEIYTIREIYTSPKTGILGIRLEEILNPVSPIYKLEYGFDYRRFRPVHTIESDSEMFRRISEDSLGRLEILEEVINEL